eukprot:756805-Hanusia_phi.AAC.5
MEKVQSMTTAPCKHIGLNVGRLIEERMSPGKECRHDCPHVRLGFPRTLPALDCTSFVTISFLVTITFLSTCWHPDAPIPQQKLLLQSSLSAHHFCFVGLCRKGPGVSDSR